MPDYFGAVEFFIFWLVYAQADAFEDFGVFIAVQRDCAK
jgi:hypothetical protein